jgi:FlaG/FlaF family flagellin (archaellin)
MNKSVAAIAAILVATLVVIAITLAATPEAFAKGRGNSIKIQKNVQNAEQHGSGNSQHQCSFNGHPC